LPTGADAPGVVESGGFRISPGAPGRFLSFSGSLATPWTTPFQSIL
jgi:hypothetical protein